MNTKKQPVFVLLSYVLMLLMLRQSLCEAGTILREYWTNISGSSVSDLTGNSNFPNNPSGTYHETSFSAPVDWADDYGTRMRGFICAPYTGNYRFWISSDDASELWLSTDGNTANKVKIAQVDGWTWPNQWDKYSSQQSSQIFLEQNHSYYIEALQKEGWGGDHLSVRWQLPDNTIEEPIPGGRLSETYSNPPSPPPVPESGTILREYWFNINGSSVSDLTGNINFPNSPSGTSHDTSFSAPVDWANNYGTRMHGYIYAPQSGFYHFWIASDDASELWLSTDGSPSNKVKIAQVDDWTLPNQWDKYSSQQSSSIYLVQNHGYYIEALQKEGGGADHLSVRWQLPDNSIEEPIPGSRLSENYSNPPAPPASEDYSLWTYQKDLVLNTTATGANISNNVYDFPVLVRLNDATLWPSNAKSNGTDIRFCKTDGTHLPFELVSWDNVNHQAEFWVAVDTVYGNSNANGGVTIIKILWGNGSASGNSSPAEVFNTLKGFQGIWHLSQSPVGDSTVRDASGNLNHGTGYSMQTSDNLPGLIGNGMHFAGSQANHPHIYAEKPASNIASYTISAWFNTISGEGGKILGLGTDKINLSPEYDRHIWMTNDGRINAGIYNNTYHYISSARSYNDGQWHLATTQLSSSGQYLFIDGDSIGYDAGATAEGQCGYGYWHIGGDNMYGWPDNPSSWFFGGLIDEARVENIARSKDWIKLCYENQKGAQALIAYGLLNDISHSEWAYSPTFQPSVHHYIAIVPAAVDALVVTPVAALANTAILVNGANPTQPVHLHSFGIPTTIVVRSSIPQGMSQVDTLEVVCSNNSVIYVNDNSPCTPGSENGTSWSYAFKDLQQALTEAEMTGKEIWIAEGTYKPTHRTVPGDPRSVTYVIKPGMELIGGFAGFSNETKSSKSGSVYNTILSGDISGNDLQNGDTFPTDSALLADNAYHVVTMIGHPLSGSILLSNLTVARGVANDKDNACGGGVFSPQCQPSFDMCVFSHNIAKFHGGALFSNNGISRIKNCLFESNVSLAGNGGGLYVTNGANVIVEGSVFSKNSASGTANAGDGGACYFEKSTAHIVNSIVVGNQAAKTGAAVFNCYATSYLTNCTVTGNFTPGSGINNDNSTAIVANSILWHNAEGRELTGNGFTVSYSCITGGATGTGNISTDPLFSDSLVPKGEDGNFGGKDDGLRLSKFSPCRDVGTLTNAPQADLILIARPWGSAIDMGAYEYEEYLTDALQSEPLGRLRKGIFVPEQKLEMIDYLYHWKYVRMYARSNLARVLRVEIPRNENTDKHATMNIYVTGANSAGVPLPDMPEVSIELTRVASDANKHYYQSQTTTWGKPLLFVNDPAFHNWPNVWAYVIYVTDEATWAYRVPYDQFE